MTVPDGVGQQVTGNLRWRHRDVRTRLAQQGCILLLAGIRDDACFRVELAHGQYGQRVGVVATGTQNDGTGPIDAGVTQYPFHGRVAPQADVALHRGFLQQVLALVYHHDLVGRRPATYQFARRGTAAVAITADDDVIPELLLQSRHADALQSLVEEQFKRGANEHQPDQQSGRGDDDRINEPRSLGDGHDVAVADRGQADDHEIDQVYERQLAVDHVADPVAVEPEHEGHDGEQAEDDAGACSEHAAGPCFRAGEQNLVRGVASQAADASREGRHAAPGRSGQSLMSR